MGNLIRYWDVKTGNLVSFGDTQFVNRSFNHEVQEAVCRLTTKILQTDIGSAIATRVYRSGKKVIPAVEYTKEGILKLKVMNDLEEGTFLDIAPFLSEIQKIQAALERQGLIPIVSTSEKTRAIFNQVKDEREAEANAPTLTSHLRSLKEQVLRVSNVDKAFQRFVSKIITVIKVFEAFALFCGIVLSISGISLAKGSFNDMGTSQLHRNYEKFLLACADLFAGLNVIATSVLFLMEKIAGLAHKLVTAAAAGAALPVTVFMFYATALLSSIYKLYVQKKFKSEFDAMVGSGTDAEKKAAVVWLKQKTQISGLEEKKYDENGIFCALHKKWEQFTLRTGREAFESLLNPETLETILNRGDSSSIQSLIDDVKAASQEAIKWSTISVFANTIGFLGMASYLVFAGHVGILLSSALLTLAMIISLYVDYPKARKEIAEGIRFVMQKIKEHCTKSEKPIKKEECSSTASSTISDQKEVSPQTLLKLTEETFGPLMAS